MEAIFFLIGIAFVVAINVHLARGKNRSVYTWGVLGGIFGILTTIILLCLPKVEVEAAE